MDSFAQLSSPSPAQWMILIALAGILATIAWSAVRTKKPHSIAGRESTIDPRAVRNDLTDLLTELQNLSNKIDTQVNTKYAELERAVREADKRITALRTLLAVAPRPGAASSSSTNPESAQTTPPLKKGGLGGVAPEETPPNQIVTDPRARRIYALADEGRTPLQIAQQLEQPQGEIELILNLRKKSPATL